jgi:hypothetical protein
MNIDDRGHSRRVAGDRNLIMRSPGPWFASALLVLLCGCVASYAQDAPLVLEQTVALLTGG